MDALFRYGYSMKKISSFSLQCRGAAKLEQSNGVGKNHVQKFQNTHSKNTVVKLLITERHTITITRSNKNDKCMKRLEKAVSVYHFHEAWSSPEEDCYGSQNSSTRSGRGSTQVLHLNNSSNTTV